MKIESFRSENIQLLRTESFRCVCFFVCVCVRCVDLTSSTSTIQNFWHGWCNVAKLCHCLCWTMYVKCFWFSHKNQKKRKENGESSYEYIAQSFKIKLCLICFDFISDIFNYYGLTNLFHLLISSEILPFQQNQANKWIIKSHLCMYGLWTGKKKRLPCHSSYSYEGYCGIYFFFLFLSLSGCALFTTILIYDCVELNEAVGP